MKFNSNGFSLIEILVVISIGAIMTMGGLAAYSQLQTQQSLKSAVRYLRSTLYTVREEALLGKKPSSCVGALLGKKVTVEDSGGLVVLKNISICGGAVVEKEFSFDKGITISVSPDQNYYFTSVNTGTTMAVDETIYTVGISDKSATVTVNKFGNIE